jgi:hypothetical protein
MKVSLAKKLKNLLLQISERIKISLKTSFEFIKEGDSIRITWKLVVRIVNTIIIILLVSTVVLILIVKLLLG